ncbi:MAG: hypothetical protein QM597_05510 [Aeromicrobium sp.]|uniref:hypothetical protein n=1 Tax=Aeromicrobium sp. TaxID=1871063 RepID=UPI0039E376F1
MKSLSMTLIGLLAAAALSACGPGYTEDDLREEIADRDLGKKVTDCIVEDIKGGTDSLSDFGQLDESDRESSIDAAAMACVDDASDEDLANLVGEVDLTDPSVREQVIAGMVDSGLPEETANCLVDEALAQGLDGSALLDASAMESLAAACMS